MSHSWVTPLWVESVLIKNLDSSRATCFKLWLTYVKATRMSVRPWVESFPPPQESPNSHHIHPLSSHHFTLKNNVCQGILSNLSDWERERRGRFRLCRRRRRPEERGGGKLAKTLVRRGQFTDLLVQFPALLLENGDRIMDRWLMNQN